MTSDGLKIFAIIHLFLLGCCVSPEVDRNRRGVLISSADDLEDLSLRTDGDPTQVTLTLFIRDSKNEFWYDGYFAVNEGGSQNPECSQEHRILIEFNNNSDYRPLFVEQDGEDGLFDTLRKITIRGSLYEGDFLRTYGDGSLIGIQSRYLLDQGEVVEYGADTCRLYN